MSFLFQETQHYVPLIHVGTGGHNYFQLCLCPVAFSGCLYLSYRIPWLQGSLCSPFSILSILQKNSSQAARQPGAQPATTPPSSAFNLTSQLVELPLLQVRVLVQMVALLNNFIYINSHFKSQSQESYTLMTNDILGGFF